MNIKRVNPLTDNYYNILAMLMTHDSLVRFDPDFRVVPQLAESWSCREGGRIWKFKLVSDAKWHDGHPVTPEDIGFTFRYLAKHNVSSGWISDLIENIGINGREVIFTLKKPHSRFLIDAGFSVRILPRHIWEKIEDPQRAVGRENTVGCGPYIFDSFDRKANRIYFDVNDEYFGVIPLVDRIEFRIYQNMDVLTLELLEEKIDLYYKYASGYPVQYLGRLRKDRNLRLVEADSAGVPAALGFNLTHKPLDRKGVRKAVSSAINYERINRCLFEGKGEVPGTGFVPPVFPFRMELPGLRYDPEESKRLLSSEGLLDRNEDGTLDFPDGKELSLNLLGRTDLWGEEQLVRLLAHDLKEVGIHVKIQLADLSTWIALLQDDRHDLVLFRTTPWGMMMHAGYASGYFDSRRKGGGIIGNLTDPDFHAICDRILTTTEPSILEDLFHELQTYYADYLPAVALCWNKNIYPFNKNRQGLQVHQLEGGLANRFSWRTLSFEKSAGSRE